MANRGFIIEAIFDRKVQLVKDTIAEKNGLELKQSAETTSPLHAAALLGIPELVTVLMEPPCSPFEGWLRYQVFLFSDL